MAGLGAARRDDAEARTNVVTSAQPVEGLRASRDSPLRRRLRDTGREAKNLTAPKGRPEDVAT